MGWTSIINLIISLLSDSPKDNSSGVLDFLGKQHNPGGNINKSFNPFTERFGFMANMPGGSNEKQEFGFDFGKAKGFLDLFLKN